MPCECERCGEGGPVHEGRAAFEMAPVAKGGQIDVLFPEKFLEGIEIDGDNAVKSDTVEAVFFTADEGAKDKILKKHMSAFDKKYFSLVQVDVCRYYEAQGRDIFTEVVCKNLSKADTGQGVVNAL
jgi:hypothetical protein